MPVTTSPLSRFKIGRRKLLIATAALGLLSTLGAQTSWAASAKNVLHTSAYLDIVSLDPAFGGNIPDENVMGAIYNKLIYYKPGSKWEWELQAAKSIEQIDDTHIAFELRPGIQFSNGFGEMTAEDVKFSFERIIDPKLKAPNVDTWRALDHVEVTGRYTGTIVLKQASQPLWYSTLPFYSGNILSKKATESVGGTFGNKPPAVSGPYRLKEWKPKQQVVLERNPDWSGQPAGYDEIHIHQIDDEKTSEIAFESGDVDFAQISLSSLSNYRQQLPANTQLSVHPSLYYAWVGMNLESPKLQDVRVRKAVQLAIDVPSILAAAYFDAAEPATGIIAPGLIGHREKSLIAPQANIAEAKRLLAEAGHANGLELSIDVLNTSTFVTAAQVIQATLAQAGIKLTVNQHESGSFWSLGDEKSGDRWKSVELIMNRFSMVPDPSYATIWFTTAQKGIWNWERFSNPEFDALHEQALSEASEDKRGAMYQRMQDLMEESGAYRFITHEAAPLLYRSSIKPAMRPDGIPLYRLFQPSKG
jgi:peptide/nickel transport system substrate-binding protein